MEFSLWFFLISVAKCIQSTSYLADSGFNEACSVAHVFGSVKFYKKKGINNYRRGWGGVGGGGGYLWIFWDGI